MYIRARIQIFANKTERSKAEIGTLSFVYSKLQGLVLIGANPIFMLALTVLCGKRAKRTQDIFNFDETTAVFHKELLENDFVLERINEEKESEVLSTLYKAFDTLTEKQKSRVVKYYVKDKTLRDIAEEENVKYQTINESLEEAIKK